MAEKQKRITVEQIPVLIALFAEYSKLLGFSNNRIIVDVLSAFLIIPNRVWHQLVNHYREMICQLEAEIASLNEFFREPRTLILNHYRFMLFCVSLAAPCDEESLDQIRKSQEFAAQYFRTMQRNQWKLSGFEEMVLPKSSKRVSVELPQTLADLLSRIKKETGLSFSRVANYIIFAFLFLPREVRKEEMAFLQRLTRQAEREAAALNEYAREPINREKDSYEQLLFWFSYAATVKGNEIKVESPMRSIRMKVGYITFPAEWIVLNEAEAASSRYAFAVEVAHVEGAPHLLFFTDLAPREQDQAFLDDIYSRCAETWPPFSEYWTAQTQLRTDDAGFPLNLREWEESPLVGAFPVPVSGDPKLPLDYKPPYGAQIVADDLGLYFDENGNEI